MKRISTGAREKAKQIVLLLLDVDGVLTDGRIILDDRGVETKQFHVRDGQGISLLMRAGIEEWTSALISSSFWNGLNTGLLSI